MLMNRGGYCYQSVENVMDEDDDDDDDDGDGGGDASASCAVRPSDSINVLHRHQRKRRHDRHQRYALPDSRPVQCLPFRGEFLEDVGHFAAR
jgi:hypothetical protein